MGQRTFSVGDEPKAANLVKLSGNFLIASVIEALGEALALVGKAGIDRRRYLDFLTSTLFTAPIYKTYGGLIAEQKFEPPGFAAPLGAKDIRLALAAAETYRVPMPLASLLRDRLLTLLAHGGDALFWSAIGQIAAKDAGLGHPPERLARTRSASSRSISSCPSAASSRSRVVRGFPWGRTGGRRIFELNTRLCGRMPE